MKERERDEQRPIPPFFPRSDDKKPHLNHTAIGHMSFVLVVTGKNRGATRMFMFMFMFMRVCVCVCVCVWVRERERERGMSSSRFLPSPPLRKTRNTISITLP